MRVVRIDPGEERKHKSKRPNRPPVKEAGVAIHSDFVPREDFFRAPGVAASLDIVSDTVGVGGRYRAIRLAVLFLRNGPERLRF